MPVAHLSGGQRQILALELAMQSGRKLLLLDEITAALDATARKEAVENVTAAQEDVAAALLKVDASTTEEHEP